MASAVQLEECCKHAVGACDDGDKAGGADYGAAGAVADADGGNSPLLRFFFLHGY